MKQMLITVCLILTGCAISNSKSDIKKEYQAAETQYQAGQYTNAKQGFESVLEDDSSHIEARFRLGSIAVRNKQLDKAKMHYEAILKLDRRHAKSHYNLGLIYLMQSERYFQYFTATSTQDKVHPRLLKLLDSINRFSVERSQNDTSLDALTDSLSDDKPR
ncbi:MAG: tetratricopeptide repeat protein [Methylococcales bacterium]